MLRAIVVKELLLLSRDIHALAVLFLMPLAFILIMSLALQDTMREEAASNPRVGLVRAAGEALPKSLGRDLEGLAGFQVLPVPPEQADAGLLDGGLVAVVRLPAGFVDNIEKSRPDPARRLQIRYAPTTDGLLRQLLYSVVAKALASYQLDRLLSNNATFAMKRAALKHKFLGSTLIETLDVAGPAGGHPSSVQQSVPAWLIFSMFLVVIPIATTLLTERQQGTLQRLKTLPVPGGYLLLGKLVPYFFINMVQTLLMFLVGIHLVPLLGGEGLQLGDNYPLLLPMSAAVSLAAISLALLLATLVRSTEQATTVGGVGNLLLAAVGGIMVPVYIMPDFMQAAAAFSPMNWGLEGFFDILLRHGDLAMIAPEMGRLVLLSLVLLGAALFRYNRVAG